MASRIRSDPTNATMLYGHIETLAERVDHLLRLRAQQDASGGFLTFVALPYQVGTTRLVPRPPRPPTICARSPRAAAPRQLPARRGVLGAPRRGHRVGSRCTSVADDVNGTLEDERVQHMAGAETPAGLAREQLFRIIRDAARSRSERDALYNVVRVWDSVAA